MYMFLRKSGCLRTTLAYAGTIRKGKAGKRPVLILAELTLTGRHRESSITPNGRAANNDYTLWRMARMEPDSYMDQYSTFFSS